MRIQIAPCCKTNLTDDWSSYWFYVKLDMSKIPRYEGPAHPLSSPIEALTVVNTAEFNHRAVGIKSCENAFHLASTILGGRDIVEEFVAARIWPISYGWAPNDIVHFNVNWASQEVPFPKFGVKLREVQSVDAFMLDVEKRVNLMIGEYTMNEYKAYKALVKHKRKINRVFSEVCGDKAFPRDAQAASLRFLQLLLPAARSLLRKPRGEDLPKTYPRLSTRLHLLAFNPRRHGLLSRRSADAKLPNKFWMLNFRQPLALLR
jgi:hypothetical protein